MPRLRTLRPKVCTLDTSTVRLSPKRNDPVYVTPQYKAWRAQVIARANGQCEAIVNGVRCSRAHPDHRMFADHIIELKDGGLLTDINNGMCLCSSHHEIKTIEARKQRQRRNSE
jgi:hypothetical protein